MAKLSLDLTAGTLHPREDIFAIANLASLNAEVIIDTDGCSTVVLDRRGTFNMTTEVSGTIDGVNWQLIPIRPINQAGALYLTAVLTTVQGSWVGSCAGYRQVRARATAYTSGSATTTLSGSNALFPTTNVDLITPAIGTTVGASGAATTLTVAAPGAGLRQYLTYLSIGRYAAAVLTASATPVTVTTTNLPGSLAFTFPADAAALGSMDRWREDFAYPIAASAQNTAVTIVCPATTGVIWRVTAGYYVAP